MSAVHRDPNPDDWSSFATDIGAPRLCTACRSADEVVEAWVSGADQLLCRECIEAWLRLVWSEAHRRHRRAA
jgi:hypothetical protein